MGEVLGRTNDNFITPEGNIIYGTYFVRQMYGIKGVKEYQFHQVSKEAINLYVVKDHNFSQETSQHLENIKRTIAEGISGRIRLNLLFREEISPGPSGKHRYVLSDVASNPN